MAEMGGLIKAHMGWSMLTKKVQLAGLNQIDDAPDNPVGVCRET
jgi:hypothetical protein